MTEVSVERENYAGEIAHQAVLDHLKSANYTNLVITTKSQLDTD